MKIHYGFDSTLGSTRSTGLFLACAMFVVLALFMNQWLKSDTPPDTRASCVANLDLISRAKAAWALDNMKLFTDVPRMEDLFGAEHFHQTVPECPNGGYYTVGSVESTPKCSFAGHTL